ncbi:tRNA pseudouridine synthase B [Aliarcobacter thereius]|uniref:tRNA pseudouridine synthase B n=1 Tax=Aliarcobacter thereius TaxID=544718 RepID=A0A1C0B9K2_9BACT|nr:tRNA pseudouridine(55) synthase TruB [Aliarcobacter thereius]OCM00242.1 tRNA pseudouridine synthase B [Aliarcobacter thereius]
MQKRVYEKYELNKLFVVNKPIFISSNFYLNKFKRLYKNKKAGFSGTLDPFAKGCLIVAFGQYAKLFKYFRKTPKRYRAVIWLGVSSESFDIERIYDIKLEEKLEQSFIEEQLNNLVGDLEYIPPKFSAKRVNGLKAYELAREGIDFELEKSIMKVFDIKFLKYNHPFISFEASVSEGSYIRSLSQIFLEKIKLTGTLSYLERLSEGEFKFQNHKELNPLDFLDLEKNIYTGTKEWLDVGRKISIDYIENKKDGKYIIELDDFFSIIEINSRDVKYLLNKIPKQKVNND